MILPRLATAAVVAAGLAAGSAQPLAAQRPLSVCVVTNNSLRLVPATYDTETGDTLVGRRPFSTVYTQHAGYAASHAWYRSTTPILFDGEYYVKFGLPRVYGVTEVVRVGALAGVGVYADAGSSTRARLYLPIRSGCEFQPYTVVSRPADVAAAAEDAMERRQYATSRRLLERPDVATHGRVRTLLGRLYHYGYGVGVDTAAARRHYAAAVEARDAEGYRGLGLLAAAKNDFSAAATWYRMGIARGSGESAALLADLHLRGRAVGLDDAGAVRLMRVALTRANSTSGIMRLNSLYESGRGVEGDAVEWFTRDSVDAAKVPIDGFARFRMARRYEMGWGTWPDSAKAAAMYRAGARSGDVSHRRAADRLGLRYE